MKNRVTIIVLLVLTACSGSDAPSALEKGWNAFSAGNYAEAVTVLTEAKTDDPQNADVRTALGWALMRTDQLESAEVEFEFGGSLTNPSPDLFAGWAFTLNALKDYGTSNAKIADVLSANPEWIFTYDSKLTREDLSVLKAENHFLLSEFDSALAAIIAINPLFSANIATDAGRGQLAAEIERLKGELSKRLKK